MNLVIIIETLVDEKMILRAHTSWKQLSIDSYKKEHGENLPYLIES